MLFLGFWDGLIASATKGNRQAGNPVRARSTGPSEGHLGVHLEAGLGGEPGATQIGQVDVRSPFGDVDSGVLWRAAVSFHR